MSHDIEFTGHVTVEPPLNADEARYLHRFARSRRFHRVSGPYTTETDQSRGDDTVHYNRKSPEQPSLNCDWRPTEDAAGIEWDGSGNSDRYDKWMQYLIDTFLSVDATLRAELAEPVPGRHYPSEFAHFTFDHVVNGVIQTKGEYEYDRGRLVVDHNAVSFEDLYHVEFSGQLTIEPPLSADEVVHLHRLVRASDARALGPYGFVAPSYLLAAAIGADASLHTRPGPDEGHPPAGDPAPLDWSGRCIDWCIQNLIDTFLAPDATRRATPVGRGAGRPEPRSGYFAVGRVINGAIEAQGDDPADRWRLVIDDNVVSVELVSRDGCDVEAWDGEPRLL
jgi:hypothetical protein